MDEFGNFRKKLSNFMMKDNWKTAANYVVKQYMDPVERKVYFDDVRLQMDAKLWGEEYNRHNPPKKVCLALLYIISFSLRSVQGSCHHHTGENVGFGRRKVAQRCLNQRRGRIITRDSMLIKKLLGFWYPQAHRFSMRICQLTAGLSLSCI